MKNGEILGKAKKDRRYEKINIVKCFTQKMAKNFVQKIEQSYTMFYNLSQSFSDFMPSINA